MVADALSRKSMGVLAHLVVQRRTLGREIQKLANDGIRLDDTKEGGITAYALAQSSLVVHVKAKQDEDPYLVKLKEGVRNKKITAFTLGSDGVLKLNDRLCVPDVDGLRKSIMEETHSSRYSIHPSATKIYRYLKELYWWKGMKKQIANRVAKCLNCQKVKAKHQRPGGLAKDIEIPQWKWEIINMDFVVGLPRTYRKHDSIWVIVDRVTKSAHFLPVKTTYSAKQSPVGWFETAEVSLIDPEFVCEPLEKVQLIRERLKVAQSRQKSYYEKRHRDLEFMVGDKVFLKVSPMKGVMRFGKKGKLSPRFRTL
nr:uncharacterized protein LOC117273051 [Nicotiana tomentosiformis]